MAGDVESEKFSGSYAVLNGVSPLSATHADIVRSLLTVGYPSRRAAVVAVGAWRARMLVAMATGFLTSHRRSRRAWSIRCRRARRNVRVIDPRSCGCTSSAWSNASSSRSHNSPPTGAAPVSTRSSRKLCIRRQHDGP